MMEVGLLVRVPDSPGAAPDQAGQYQIPVSIKGGTHQALVDSGCNQTSIHQSLMQQRALDTSRKVKLRCVHGDVADYPLVPVSITFRGKTHRMEVAVNPHLKHPLILGTDWPAFTQLLEIVCADVSWQTGRGQEEAAAQAGEALAGPSPPASEETRVSERVKPPELDDFPLEQQSRDETLKNAFDRVRVDDLGPEAALKTQSACSGLRGRSPLAAATHRLGPVASRFCGCVFTPARSHGPRTAPYRNAPRGGGAQPSLSPSRTQEKRSSGRVKGHARLGRNRRIA